MGTLIVGAKTKLWTPAQIPSTELMLWWDAMDYSSITLVEAKVSEWSDKSGNNRHGAQTNPSLRLAYSPTELNGLPAIKADGISDLRLPTTDSNWWGTAIGAGAFSVFHVFQSASANFGSGLPYAVPRYYFLNGSFSYNTNVTIAFSASTQPQITEYSHDGVETLRARRNGTLLATGTMAAIAPYPNIPYTVPFSYGIAGVTGEHVILKGIITETIRQKITGYLAHKWGLEYSLPADHPYKNLPPRYK